MEVLTQWGVDLIVGIQQIHGPVLDSIFRAITFLGEEEFYLLLLPLLFWCVDFGVGARIAIIFLLSSYLNVCLKDLFQQVRPFELEPGVKLADAEGYSLPSNHSQSAVVVWAGVATWAQKTWFWALAIGLIVLIGFSRLYLGVHFPTDVLAGWAIGAVLLVLSIVAIPRIEKRLLNLRLDIQILLALVIPLGLLFVHPVENTTSVMGALAGIGVGLALLKKYVSFSVHVVWWQRAVRFVVGVAIVFALYIGLKVVLPGEESALYLVFRFLQYGLVGLWVSLGAPWFFRILRLVPEGKK